MMPSVQEAEAEVIKARDTLEVARLVERQAARLYQIALYQLGAAIREQVKEATNDPA